MKATYQWDSAGTSCLSEMPILRAWEVNAVLPKPPTPRQLVSEVPPAGAMSTAPQICNGCKESKILAITGKMAQSVSYDLRNHASKTLCVGLGFRREFARLSCVSRLHNAVSYKRDLEKTQRRTVDRGSLLDPP
jgi:hypothetical protein